MDDKLQDTLRDLAEKSGIEPEQLEQLMHLDALPEEASAAMGAVLEDIGRFAQAAHDVKKDK